MYFSIASSSSERNTHAGIAACVSIAFRCVCLSVCLFLCALKGKRLELSATNLVHIYSIVVTRHALTHRSKGQMVKGQRSRSHGYENRHGRTVASDMCCYGRLLRLPAWVCMSIRLPTFSSWHFVMHSRFVFMYDWAVELLLYCIVL